MINTAKMLEVLKDVPAGSTVFVSYNAGRKAGPQAALESARAISEGVNLRHFTGKLVGVFQCRGKLNQHYFTMWVEERDSIGPKGDKTPGNFRAFNPSLGTLHALEVIERAPAETKAG